MDDHLHLDDCLQIDDLSLLKPEVVVEDHVFQRTMIYRYLHPHFDELGLRDNQKTVFHHISHLMTADPHLLFYLLAQSVQEALYCPLDHLDGLFPVDLWVCPGHRLDYHLIDQVAVQIYAEEALHLPHVRSLDYPCVYLKDNVPFPRAHSRHNLFEGDH